MTPTLDETQIRGMVERFYERVREDPVLGPIFAARIDGRWPVHLDKMVDFWSSALLRTGRYAGNPRAVHASIGGIGEPHFERWLGLFEGTLADLFEPDLARSIHVRAQAMAAGLLRGIDNQRPGLAMTEATSRSPEHV